MAGKRLGGYGRLVVPIFAAVAALGTPVAAALLTEGGAGGVVGSMESLSASSATLLTGFTTLVPVGFAFGAGMVSSVNPCGFAMLPAYLGLYLGSDEPAPRAAFSSGVFHALAVGGVVTSGFVVLFGIVGLLIGAGAQSFVTLFPWIGLGVGVLLALAGSWMLTGGTLYAGLAEQVGGPIGDPRATNIRGYFLFGLSYGTASLSCTLPIFLAVVGSALAVGSLQASAFQFVMYALGMGSVILAMTLSMAVFKGAMVRWIRRALPYAQPTSAILMLLAGAYIVYYWLTVGGLLDR